MIKKAWQIISAVTILTQILLLTACGNVVNNSEDISNDNSDTANNFESTYTGYYLTSEDGVLSITNYDPDGGNIPTYQELIVYGDGAGLENEGVVYWIYIIDTSSMDPETGEAQCYMAEFADDTHEMLCEDDQYFAAEDDKQSVVNELLEMMDFAIENEGK